MQSAAWADTVTRGPYLQTGSDQQVTIHWRTDVDSSSRVYFGTSPSSLDHTAESPQSGTEHVVKLDGLSPFTRYYYKVQAGSTRIGDTSNTFVTTPSPGSIQPVRVWVLGDSGTADSRAAAVRDAYKNLSPATRTDVWLMLGDNAYSNGEDAEYQDAVFDMYPDFLKSTVLWPALGNHDGHTADSDTESGPYYDIFDLPRNAEAGGVASHTEAYYSFDYANIHFICLDSYETDRSTSGSMHQWLESDLSATGQPWIIVFWHHPPYSKGSHDSDTDSRMTDMRENFLPLLEQYGVDLVLSGHSHSYERSYLIDGHYGTSDTFDASTHLVDGGDGQTDGDGAYSKSGAPHKGSVYVVAGSSGQTSSMRGTHPVMIASSATLGSLVLDINDNRLDARFLTDSGSIYDHFTLLKNNGTTPAPPAAPDQLTATAGGPDRIDLSWHDNADNEDAFVLERSLDKQIWTETASLSANSTGHTDTPLSQATTYYYRVKARNPAGDSGYSNTARATTTGGCVVSNGAASITNRYYSNEHDICQAPDRVSAASNVTVGTDAWAEYVAPRIELAPGFHVLDGGRLTVRQP
ncbi:MAG TPA: metallophosphoesterase [Thiolapillus brandeum]|uniref:Metallophosphoesterase n=1 Tax=Thiolapillus brandeum TaxID=1076588 RepID=A0A831S0M2_9GAMM|nr:metallophosphoesterase [Thiolapillus brandeum]